MVCMKGFEEGKNGEWGYGRRIVRPNLRKPMAELCPPFLNEQGIESVAETTGRARV